MSRSDNIAKIIARMQGRIAEGSFYEAQQQTRVVVARHTKPAKIKAPADDVSEDEAAKKKRTPNWNAACDILYEVSKSLLQAGQGGSGGDLAIMLVDIYKQAADWEQNEYDRELRRARAKQAKSSEPVLMPEFTPKFVPDAANKGRLLSLLRLFDAGEPTRKKFVGEMISWSSAFGEFPAGDPELHHVAGSLFATEHDAIEAERHLILGTKDSPEILARMHYDWYKECEPHTAPMLCARSVLPYLLTANLRGANTAYSVFTSALSSDNPNLQVQDVSFSSCDIRIFPSLPLLNFLGMLLLTVQRGAPDLFRQLKQKYGADLAQVKSWDDALDGIAEQYFGIQRPRQAPSLFDMMGSMFGGGMGGSMGGGPSRGARRVGGPAAEGLD